MKKVLVIALCLVCGLAAQAQFRVYKHTGKVEYRVKKDNTATWKTVTDGIELSPIDSLRIPKKGSVRLEHIKKGLLYTSCSTGKVRVLDVVLEAQKENTRRTLARLNKEINTGKLRENTFTMSAVGGVERGAATNSKEFTQLVEQFAWIGAQAASGKQSPKEEGLRFTKNKVGKELDFIYENRTSKNYHMNVLHINKRTNIASLCYVIDPNISYGTCPITPGGCCSCSNKDLFFPNTENDVYVLVATEIPYDTYELDNALLNYPIDKAKENNIDVKYIW